MEKMIAIEYFKKPISLAIELVIFIIIPVITFLNFPALLPYRTIYIILSLFYVVLFLYESKLPMIKSVGITKNNLVPSIKSSILYALPSLLLLFIVYIFIPNKELLSENLQTFNNIPFVTFVFLYIFISVPLQEIIFRGFYTTRLKLISNNRYFITLFSAVIFSFVHVAFGKLILLPFAFVFGVLLSLLYIRHNNIVGPIIYHTIMGTGAFLLILL